MVLRTEHASSDMSPPFSDFQPSLFAEWTNSRSIASLGTNNGSLSIAFQNWHKFKEAFPPELIYRAVCDEKRDIRACIDPFGGSGTTALASQFLGISSTTIEVNPFLVDVIKAKIALLDADELAHALGTLCERIHRREVDPARYFRAVPKTFIEPGHEGRWLFDAPVAARIATILNAIDFTKDPAFRRFFRIILSGLLVPVSNVTVNGKGRRYRRNWEICSASPLDVDRLFMARCGDAIADIHRFSGRPTTRSYVIHGDARGFRSKRLHDLAIFSPPYPNSFDYTDVYNIELWMLGYLTSGDENRALRNSTLSSHVQLQRRYAKAPSGAPTLDVTLAALEAIRGDLWSQWIPSMVGAYFADLLTVLRRVFVVLHSEASCWMVVGDSRYGGIFIPTARILMELAPTIGWSVVESDPFRSMRSSSQHGGADELSETLLVLRRS
jgi:hypothetical protein